MNKAYALTLVALSLVAGAIINAAIAWSCTRLTPERSSHYPAAINVGWPVPVAPHWPTTCKIWRVRSPGAFVETCSGIGEAGELYQVSRCEFGFPRRCLVSSAGFEIDSAMVTRNPFKTPMTVAWPGFAINTVFYAVVLWLLFAGPFVVRRWRRIRRGLCPKCAYDLRGSVDAAPCPECGVPSLPRRESPGRKPHDRAADS